MLLEPFIHSLEIGICSGRDQVFVQFIGGVFQPHFEELAKERIDETHMVVNFVQKKGLWGRKSSCKHYSTKSSHLYSIVSYHFLINAFFYSSKFYLEEREQKQEKNNIQNTS